jgi:ABC-type transport system involved in Fe-S cluster assembly fused permease/ATPase subunit
MLVVSPFMIVGSMV